MTEPAAPDGEIDPSVRLFVHRQIRASAGRHLKLSVITFQDHHDDAMRNLKEELDARFIFDNYVLSFIETSMKNVKYVFHRHWLDTGRGEKHPDILSRELVSCARQILENIRGGPRDP